MLHFQQPSTAMLYARSETHTVHMVWLLIGELLLQDSTSTGALPFCTFWDNNSLHKQRLCQEAEKGSAVDGAELS